LASIAAGLPAARKLPHPGTDTNQPKVMADFDLAIVGGGINGAGIARDAAGRGLRVLLVEQNDLASGTSSTSSKLIHGGLRYLEHGAFRLVREALSERERLLGIAPHTIRPLRIVLPVTGGPRSAWMIRLGLWIYDRLGGRNWLPATETLDLAHHAAGAPLKPSLRRGYEYSDCTADDSRLVVLNALDAAERGAVIRTRARLTRAEREAEWRLILDCQDRREIATARVLVNAAGPWAGIVAETVLGIAGRPPLRLVKGSHIVVPKLFGHDHGYILQNSDRRIVFALPFAGEFTLIGTTDANFTGNPDVVASGADEVRYLCDATNRYFNHQIGPDDVRWAFAGVRSLYDDGAGKPEDVTRDYHVVRDDNPDAPLLTVYGGKITTYRRLAEAAMALLADVFAPAPDWTASAPLPGGDFAWNGLDDQVARARNRWPFLDADEAMRLVRAYGTRLDRVLGNAKTRDDLGPWFGPLSAAEVRYLMMQEWAGSAGDVLWRRTKLGLRLDAPEAEALAQFMAARQAEQS
jgi:glycerol-3-phosphate dehydrogenase